MGSIPTFGTGWHYITPLPRQRGSGVCPADYWLFVHETAACRSRALLWRCLLKLSLIFLLIDLLVLLVYPILYIVDRVRKLLRFQR